MLGGERLAEPARGWRLAQHQPAINGKRLAGQGSGIVASQHRDDSLGHIWQEPSDAIANDHS